MQVTDITNIQITRQTKAVTQQGFGTAMVLGVHRNFTDLIRTYSTLTGLSDDGFSTTQKEYVAVNTAFSQSPRPANIQVGRRALADASTITVSTATSGAVYTVKVNGQVATFTAVDAVAQNIATGIKAAIAALTLPFTLGTVSTGAFTITPTVAGTAYTLTTINPEITLAFTATGTVASDLNAIAAVDNGWYALIFQSSVTNDVLAAAAWTETQTKIYYVASGDSNIISVAPASDTTTLAAQVKALGYNRTAVIYSASVLTGSNPAAAIAGLIATKIPGSYTAMFKTLVGVVADKLTDTQSANAQGKNCMTYETVGGVDMTAKGVVGSGEYIDVIIGIDWLKSRMTERIFSRMVNLDKVPFTDAGISVIEGEVKGQLDDGIAVGLLAARPVPTVTVPKASAVSVNDKAARRLTGVSFVATLAGAIHSTTILGVVTV